MTADKREMIRRQSMDRYGFGPDAMKQVKVCEECGAPSPVDRQFCTGCGHRLPDKSLYDIYRERHRCCPVCGAVLDDETDYCPQCGTKAETNDRIKNNQ